MTIVTVQISFYSSCLLLSRMSRSEHMSVSSDKYSLVISLLIFPLFFSLIFFFWIGPLIFLFFFLILISFLEERFPQVYLIKDFFYFHDDIFYFQKYFLLKYKTITALCPHIIKAISSLIFFLIFFCMCVQGLNFLQMFFSSPCIILFWALTEENFLHCLVILIV